MVASRFRRALVDVRHQPALLALCGLVGAFEAGTWLLVAPFLAGASGDALVALLLAQRLALLAVLAILLPGCYAAARGEMGVGEALRTVTDRSSDRERRLFLSMVVSRVVAVVVTLALVLVLLGLLGVVDTAVVWVEAYAGVGTDRELLALAGVGGSVPVAFWLARGAVGLHDLRALESEVEPWRAPLWSLRAWRGRRRRLTGYALVRGVLLALPPAVAGVILQAAGLQPVRLAAAAVAFTGVTCVTRAALANYQLGTYAATIQDGDAPDEDNSFVPGRRRVAIVVMVFVVVVAGVAVVRAADVHPELDDEPAGFTPANADTTVETAIERTAARDAFVEQRTEVWNGSADRWDTETRHQILFDRSDRQLFFFGTPVAGSDQIDRTIYSTDGRFAMLRVPSPLARPGPHHVTFERGSWTVLVGPPYGWAIEERYGYPPADAGWELAEATDDRIVYRLDDGDALSADDLGPLLGVPADEDVTLDGVSDVTLVIDRDSLTVRRLGGQVAYVDARTDDPRRVQKRWEREVSDVGAVDVGQHSALPSPSLPAHLWDAVYY